MGMFEFLVHNFVIDFFASYGWIGFISYIILVYGMIFWLGVKLKSRGFFENDLFESIYYIAFLIVGWIVGWIAVWIAGWIALGIVGWIALGIEGWIALGIEYGIEFGI